MRTSILPTTSFFTLLPFLRGAKTRAYFNPLHHLTLLSYPSSLSQRSKNRRVLRSWQIPSKRSCQVWAKKPNVKDCLKHPKGRQKHSCTSPRVMRKISQVGDRRSTYRQQGWIGTGFQCFSRLGRRFSRGGTPLCNVGGPGPYGAPGSVSPSVCPSIGCVFYSNCGNRVETA